VRSFGGWVFRAGLLVLVAGLARPVAAQSSALLVEEIAAVVDKRPVLLSELELDARLFRARERGVSFFAGTVSQSELSEALERTLDRWVVCLEAERLQLFEPVPGELVAAVDALRRRWGVAALDDALNVSGFQSQDLEAFLKREVRAQRYLEGRFRLASRPRDAELQVWKAEHAAAAVPGAPVQDWAELRNMLGAQRFARLTRDFVSDLRRRVPVQRLHDFRAPGRGPPNVGEVRAVPEEAP